MQVVLIMFRTGGEHRSFSVVRTTTTIGRREDCDLRIPVGDVSRKHCRLVLGADTVRIQDLGSSNGTYVNGQRVSDQFLNPGDTVGVGPVHFVVQVDGVPDEAELNVPAPAVAGDSAAGGTALAAAALAASQAESESGDEAAVLDDAGLLEEVPDPPAHAREPNALVPDADALVADDISTEDAAAQPTAAAAKPASDQFTIDEEATPTHDAAAQDAAFDLTTDNDPAPAVVADEMGSVDLGDEATAGADGDWDFLVEDAAVESKVDVDVDLNGGHPHA